MKAFLMHVSLQSSDVDGLSHEERPLCRLYLIAPPYPWVAVDEERVAIPLVCDSTPAGADRRRVRVEHARRACPRPQWVANWAQNARSWSAGIPITVSRNSCSPTVPWCAPGST